MSSNNRLGARFAIGQVVKLNPNAQAEGLNTFYPRNHRSDMPICKTAPTDVNVPASAKYWGYRLQATLSDTYTVYQADEMIDKAKGRVKHTHVTKTQGTTVIEPYLIEPGQVVFLLKPFKYQAGSKTVTLNPGTPVGIVGKATTNTGGLPGEVSPQNAYYTIQTVIAVEYNYTWKSHYYIRESQLTAA